MSIITKQQAIEELWSNRQKDGFMGKVCTRCYLTREDSCSCTKNKFVKNLTEEEINECRLELLAIEKSKLLGNISEIENTITDIDNEMQKLSD